ESLPTGAVEWRAGNDAAEASVKKNISGLEKVETGNHSTRHFSHQILFCIDQPSASSLFTLCYTAAVLKLKAVDRGVVVIQGTEASRYLAMSDEGRLYSSPTITDECYFLERLEENHYNTYQPQKYHDNNWYVALKKNGKPKLGPRTHIGQKAVFFLPRQLDD
uniref:Fibroblast growth factor n=1 Tax=Astatotilapia calliptera TaxID=8154 RepID=A0AAX7T2I3_ASTCA